MSNLDSSVREYTNKYRYPNQITEEELNNDYNNLISEYNIIKNDSDTVVSKYKIIDENLVAYVKKYKKNRNTHNEYSNDIKKMIAKHGALVHCFYYYEKVKNSMDNIINNKNIY